MKHKVFVSYSSKDKLQIHELEETLQMLGASPLRDAYDLHAGEGIEDWVMRVLERHADVVVVAMSNNSLTSAWVEKEVAIAEEVAKSQRHLPIIYVNISPDTEVPKHIRDKAYIDLSLPDRVDVRRETAKLARLLMQRSPLQSHGVYDVYSDWSDMDQRRENAAGDPGCTVYDFLGCAHESIASVGLWFGHLFGNDQGMNVADLLQVKPDLQVDLYMPDPDAEVAVQHLAYIHEAQKQVLTRLTEFIENRFMPWARHRRIPESDAKRCRLHLLRYTPTASMLAIDHAQSSGRIIFDAYAAGITPKRQLKVEMRYPGTPLYGMCVDNLKYIASPASVTRTILSPTS